MTAGLVMLAEAALQAAKAANDVTLTLLPDGVDVRVQGRRDVIWPGLPATSARVPWDQLAHQPHQLGATIAELDTRITTLRAERLQKELG